MECDCDLNGDHGIQELSGFSIKERVITKGAQSEKSWWDILHSRSSRSLETLTQPTGTSRSEYGVDARESAGIFTGDNLVKVKDRRLVIRPIRDLLRLPVPVLPRTLSEVFTDLY